MTIYVGIYEDFNYARTDMLNHIGYLVNSDKEH